MLILRLTLTTLLLYTPGWVTAQEQNRPPGGGSARGMPGNVPNLEQRVKRMSQQLNLDEQQQVELRKILQTSMESRPQVREMSQYEAQPALCRHILETDQQIAGILTPDQEATYAQLKEKRKAQRSRSMDCSQYEQKENPSS